MKVLESTLSLVGSEIASMKDLTDEELEKKIVSARYVLDEDSDLVYLEKIKNGEVLERVRVGDKKWFDSTKKYETPYRFTPYNSLPFGQCPTSCGLCSAHQNSTALLNIVLTNRCNLNCFYCFFYAEKAGYVHEPSLEDILWMVDSAKAFNKGKIYAVQLTGGEPTLREDLPEIVKAVKDHGVSHIQLNTQGVRIGIMNYNSPEKAADYVKSLREAGVNTVYLSFDGTTPEINFKNHYEIPFIFDAFAKGGLTSVALVPTLINGWNFPQELGKIVKFAANNMNVVRGVNFQPVSFVGHMTKKEIEEVEKKRVTISDFESQLEKQLSIPRDAWRPIPFMVPIIKILGKDDLGFYNNPKCGEATYVVVDRSGDDLKFHPITEYIDVDKLYYDVSNAVDGDFQRLKKIPIIMKLLSGSYIKKDELPDGTKISKLLRSLFLHKDYESAGELNYKLLYLGTMHFMDPFDYDIKRVMRCSIHYSLPDGRVIPFCAYNVFPTIYRDKTLKEFSVSTEKLKENEKYYKELSDFRKQADKIRDNEIYKKIYSI